MNKKPKILILISTFFPARNGGGPVVSLLNFSKALKDVFDIYFISDHHDFGDSKPYSTVKEGWNKTNDYNIYYIPCRENSRKHINRVIDEIYPDVIYLNSILDYHYSIPVLMNTNIKSKKIPLIISSRGEMCEGAFNIKKYKKLPYISILRFFGILKNANWHVTSEDEEEGIIKYINANKKQIFYAENIPTAFDINIFDKEKKVDSLNLVFVSRIQKKKNLYGAIKMLNKVKEIKVNFDIFGPM
ncbi:TPA: hypothetical protein ACOTJ5_002496 [Clostridium perfringens]